MKIKNKNIIYSVLFILVSMLYFSCSSPLTSNDEDNGSIKLTIGSLRAPDVTPPSIPEITEDGNIGPNLPPLDVDTSNIIYTVTVKSNKNSFSRSATTKENTPLVIENIPVGNYTVSVLGEDDDYFYKGSASVKIDSSNQKEVLIKEINIELKGGQIALFFRGINFDQNAKFNVAIHYQGKLLHEKNDIPVTEIINGVYVIPIFLPEDNYSVLVTGGNIEEEKYQVNKGDVCSVIKGEIKQYDVFAKPYKVFYVSEGNGDTADNGTSNNPTHSLSYAVSSLKNYQGPVKIIVSGTVVHSGTVIDLYEGQDITFEGRNNASIIQYSGEILRINGANVSLKNISISTEQRGLTSVTFNSGNLNIFDNVYIDEMIVKQSSHINLIGSLQKEGNKTTKIILDNYTEGSPVFNLSMSSFLDPSKVVFSDSNFTLDNRGCLKRKTKTLNFKIDTSELAKDTLMTFKDVVYRVCENNKEIIPLRPVGENNIVSLETVKCGHRYDIEVLFKKINNGKDDTSGVRGNDVGYYYRSFGSVDVVDSSPETIEEKVTLGGSNYVAGSINLQGTTGDFIYPLTLSLKGSNGNVINTKIQHIPTFINYIPFDTYEASLIGDDLDVVYEVPKTIKVSNGTTADVLQATSKPNSVYYVGSNTDSVHTGTISSPFTSLSEAITSLQDVIGRVTIKIKENIECAQKIDITTPMNIVIAGNGDTRAEIICNSGLLNLQNPNCEVTMKNVHLKSPTLAMGEENNIFNIEQGTLNLTNVVALDTTPSSLEATPTLCYAKLRSTGHINVGNTLFLLGNGYVFLEDGAKVTLVSKCLNPLKIKAQNPSLGLQVVESGNPSDKDFIKKNKDSITYLGDSYSIDSNGKLIPFNHVKVDELDTNVSGSGPFDIAVYVETREELRKLGKKLRRFPIHTVNLTVTPSSQVREIGPDDFNFDRNGNLALLSLTIGEGFEIIGANSFSNSPYLTTINLPSTLRKIDQEAFAVDNMNGYEGIPTTIKIATFSVREIGTKAFYGRSLEPPVDSVPYYSLWIVDDVQNNRKSELKETDGKNLLSLINRNRNGVLTLKRVLSVKEAINIIKEPDNNAADLFVNIGDNQLHLLATAIKENPNRKEISLYISHTDTTIDTIPAFTFENCPGLVSITIPSTIKTIEPKAFAGCTYLTNARFTALDYEEIIDNQSPWKLVKGGETVTLSDKTDLASKLTTQYVDYKWSAPYGFEELKQKLKTPNADVPQTLLVYLVPSDFEASVPPKQVISNYQGEVTLDLSLSTELIAIPNNAFSFNDGPSIRGCTNINGITLPSSITSIGREAFLNCSNLATVNIPFNVSNIGLHAFKNSGLTSANFEDLSSSWTIVDTSGPAEQTKTFTPSQNSNDNADKLKMTYRTWTKNK